MPRVVSLYLPTWPTDRLRRTPGAAAPPSEVPLALIGREGRRRVVLAADVLALRTGVRTGMPATQAKALVRELVVLDADPAADRQALERLALWALRRYAPIASADPPDGLVIDTTGAEHLHGGEETMLGEMVERLAASGIAAQAAVADSWGAAHAVARWLAQPTRVVPAGESEVVLRPLPIAALRLPGDIVDGLRVLGFDRIGELAAQPRAPLALRFGPEVGRRLDQAIGTAGRADHAASPGRARRGSPRLRGTHLRGRDHRALHRKAGRGPLREARTARPRRPTAGPDLHPGRCRNRRDPRRHGAADP